MTVRGTIALVSLLAVFGCDKASKIATGSLSGTAKYAGKTDHSGISVSAGGFSTVTDATGAYSFAALAVGAYSVTAVAPASTERTVAVNATVNGGANTAAPDIVFTPAQALAGQLTVLGAPVANATVTLDGGPTATTDANGVYSFPNAAGGKHSLAFSATGASPDRLDNVFYAPELGALTTDAFLQDAFYRLDPYDLQVATRLTSLNLVNPSRSISVAPFLSPDGALYGYGISNDLGLISLFVGSTAGGAPVLVVQDHTGVTPRFSPNSKFLTFSRRNASTGITDLWVAEIGAGPSTVKTEKIVEGISSFDFSPQTTGPNGPTVYVLYSDANAVGSRSLSERTLGGAAGAGSIVNTWQGVTSFQLSRKQNRIVFKWDGLAATPSNRIASAAATGAAVTAQIVEGPGADFSWSFHGFSPDESRWAYTIFAQNAGGTATLGFKAVPTANVSKVLISTADTAVGTTPFCVSFDATGSRVIWARNASAQMVARRTDASNAEIVLVNFFPSFVCPVLTSDARAWIVYSDGATNHIALANADAAAAPVDVETGNDFGSISFAQAGGAVAAFTRVSGPTTDFYVRPLAATASTKVDTASDSGSLTFVAKNGSSVLYTKRELGPATTSNTLYWVGTSGATPTQPVRSVPRISSLTANPAETHFLVRYLEEAGNPATAGWLDLASGQMKPVLRRNTSLAVLDVGTATLAPRAILTRTGSLVPYRQQDGIYLAAP